jgi:hypothetical protein
MTTPPSPLAHLFRPAPYCHRHCARNDGRAITLHYITPVITPLIIRNQTFNYCPKMNLSAGVALPVSAPVVIGIRM